jgi:hypothetical protein
MMKNPFSSQNSLASGHTAAGSPCTTSQARSRSRSNFSDSWLGNTGLAPPLPASVSRALV